MVLRRSRGYPRHMADIFDVIADGTRREILQLLLGRSESGADGTSVSHIVQELGVSQPTVSKHLKVLREAGLVSVREEGQHRFYSIEPDPLESVEDWVVPFLIEKADAQAMVEMSMATTLPEPAVMAADVVGRVAASAKHVVQSAIKKLPGGR